MDKFSLFLSFLFLIKKYLLVKFEQLQPTSCRRLLFSNEIASIVHGTRPSTMLNVPQ